MLAVFCYYTSKAKEREENNILNTITMHGELRVGMLRSLTTLYIDNQNPTQVGGFEYAFLQQFAQALNVKLKVIFANDVDELLQKSVNNQIDIIAAEIRGSDEARKTFIMGDPYHYSKQQLVYRKGSVKPYAFQDILGNLTVAENSLQSYLLQNISSGYPDLQWYESPELNVEELLKLVDDKKINYTIANNRTIAIMQRIYPSIAVAFDVIHDNPTAWFFPASPDKSLFDRANQFIAESKKNGTLQKLEYHYFSYMNHFDYVDTRTFIRAINKTLPKYQMLFEKYAAQNNMDWKFIAAMAYQESHWNPKAASSTGVRGIMMLTKSTAESLGIKNRLNPEQSIRGGTSYLKQLLNRIPKSIEKEERKWFALAAYNMGMGHLWDARTLAKKLGKNPDSWQDIKKVLPLLSEEEYYTELKYGFARGYQAIHFVDSIQQYYISLVGYLLEKTYRQKSMDSKTYVFKERKNNTK